MKDAEENQTERIRKEPYRRIGLSPAKSNQNQNQGSKFRTSRLASSAKYDFEKDFKKEMSKEGWFFYHC